MTPKMAKLVLLTGLAVLALTGYALLTPSTGKAEAMPCVATSLLGYTHLGSTGCTIGEKTFSDFNVPFSTVSSGDIFVTPIDSTSNPGLEFSSPDWIVTFPEDPRHTDINYHVQVSPSGHPIDDISLSLTKPDTTFGGFVDLEKDATGDSQLVILDGGKSSSRDIQFDSGSFSPAVFSVNMTDFLVLEAPSAGDSASLDSFTQNFSEVSVPEPAPFILLGTALFGLTARAVALGVLRRESRFRRGRMDGI